MDNNINLDDRKKIIQFVRSNKIYTQSKKVNEFENYIKFVDGLQQYFLLDLRKKFGANP